MGAGGEAGVDRVAKEERDSEMRIKGFDPVIIFVPAAACLLLLTP